MYWPEIYLKLFAFMLSMEAYAIVAEFKWNS